jgi:hypothetical protein
VLVVPSIVSELARCSDASCRSRRGHQFVGAVSPLVAEAAGDWWSRSAEGAAMAGRLVVEVG